jgi:hypothetical protein
MITALKVEDNVAQVVKPVPKGTDSGSSMRFDGNSGLGD